MFGHSICKATIHADTLIVRGDILQTVGSFIVEQMKNRGRPRGNADSGRYIV